MDPKFLRKIQDAGWHLEQVGEKQVVAKCPSRGCGMRALLNAGTKVPEINPPQPMAGLYRPVETWDDMRRVFRERREAIGLRLHELEDVVGVATDYLAKAEKEDPAKTPNAQTAFDWGQAMGLYVRLKPMENWPQSERIPNMAVAMEFAKMLGFEVQIVEGPIQDASALSMICDTRDKLISRRKRVRVDRERRGAGSRPARGA